MTKLHGKTSKVITEQMDEKAKGLIRNISPYTADALNPFILHQQPSLFDILKSVLLTLTLLPLRLLLMILILVFAWLVAVTTLIGIPEDQAQGLEPLSGWRRRWAKPFIASLARFVFFAGGWYWIPQKGHRATAKEAPILLVMPHSSFLDTVVVIALGCPGMVAIDSTGRAPLFGSLVRYQQPLFVKSEDPDSRRRIADDIRHRVTSGKDWEQLLLFPEGGCGNRKALLQFKLGGFSPGVAVQPVFIRYKNKLDTITWTWESPGILKQLWLTLTQFCICCELEFLPVYRPTKHEQENPRIFANNVQNFVSNWTSTPVSRFSLEDARYLMLAKDRQLPPTAALVKFLRLRKAIGRHDMDPAEELWCLRKRNNSSAYMQGDAKQMAAYLGLERCPEALKDFFRILDQHGKDSLNMRVYDAALCLIRTDIKTKEKLGLAFKAFGTESVAEHFEAILLLWIGVPSSLSNLKTR